MAIIPVHLFGIPAEMDEITKFAHPLERGELLENDLGRIIQSVKAFYA